MQELDLGSKSVVLVKVNGESYKMRFPTMLEASNFKKYIDKPDVDELEAISLLFDKLGMPKNVVESLETDQITNLVTGLMASKKK